MCSADAGERAVETQEAWIDSALGRLYAKRWAADRSSDPAAIVLFHDSLGCVATWRDFPRRLSLATGRSVIAYDRFGYGRSDPRDGPQAPNFIGDEADGAFAELRRALGLEHFVAFGHSVGGGMALRVAAAHPRACQAVVSESAQVFVEDRTLGAIRDASRTFEQPGGLERLARYHGDRARWVLNAWVDTWLSPAFAGWTLDAGLPQVNCPVLALHGDRDEYGSERHPRRIGSLVPGATVRILRDCGHVPHRERPEAVIDAVTRFLAPTATPP